MGVDELILLIFVAVLTILNEAIMLKASKCFDR